MLGFSVAAIFKAQDSGVTAFFKTAAKGADNFGKSASDAFKNTEKHSHSFIGMAAKGILVYRALGAVSNGIEDVGREFLGLEHNMRLAVVQFDDIQQMGLGSAAAIQRIAEVEKAALSAAREFGFKNSQVAMTLTALGKAGLNSTQALESLNIPMKFAKLEGEDLATTADRLIQSLNTFGMASKDPVIYGQNFRKMGDLISEAASLSTISVTALVEAITSGGGAAMFTALKETPEQFLAFAAALGNVGLTGEEIGTVLRNIPTHLIGPTAKAAGLMNMLGVSMTDVAGNAIPLADVLKDIAIATQGLGRGTQAKIFAEMFGLRAVGAAFNLTKAITETDQILLKLQNSSGSVDRKFDYVSQSMQTKLEKLGVSIDQLGGRFLQAFGAPGKSGIDSFADALDKINPAPVANGILWLGSTIWGLKDAAVACTVAFGTFYAVMNAGNVIGMVGHFGRLVGVVYALVTAGKVATAMTLLFNGTLWANPLTWVAAGIAAVVGGLVLLEMKFGFVSETASALWGVLKGIVGTMADLTGLTAVFEGITGAAKWVGQKTGLTDAWRANFGTSATDAASATSKGYSVQIPAIPSAGGGFGTFSMPAKSEEWQSVPVSAPNETRIQLQQAQWHGFLTINGAPQGSTFTQSVAGAPPVDVQLLGAAP